MTFINLVQKSSLTLIWFLKPSSCIYFSFADFFHFPYCFGQIIVCFSSWKHLVSFLCSLAYIHHCSIHHFSVIWYRQLICILSSYFFIEPLIWIVVWSTFSTVNISLFGRSLPSVLPLHQGIVSDLMLSFSPLSSVLHDLFTSLYCCSLLSSFFLFRSHTFCENFKPGCIFFPP